MMTRTFALALCLIAAVSAAPQAPQAQSSSTDPPQPYEFNYKVEDSTNSVYYGANEKGAETGAVEGAYYVWLPDGRLMTVKYTVNGDSGFVPTITFQDNANPIGQAPPVRRR